MKTTIATLTALVVTASTFAAVPADASPIGSWKKYCLENFKPGKDLDNCLQRVRPPHGGREILVIEADEAELVRIRRAD